MKGLLASRLLKGRSHADKLRKSVFRHLKPRKTSRRSSVRRCKALLQTCSSEAAAANNRERSGKEQRGRHAVYALNYNGESSEYAKSNNFDVATVSAGSRNAGSGLKDGKGLDVMSIRESEDSARHFDVTKVRNACTKIECSLEEPPISPSLSLKKEEDVIAGREAFSCTSPLAFKSCTSSSIEWYANNQCLQEENVACHSISHPEGPLISSEWEAAMSTISEAPSAISFICGGKNTGKSTFARYLINSLLKRFGKVGFLDTDVGQPEFTPSGCLSFHVLDTPIIGLPGLEMKEPERCYFFGDISPKSNPEDYLKSVFLLFNYFKETLAQSEVKLSKLENVKFPLIINTHGWIKGVGLDVLIKIINFVMPTHIVQTLSKIPTRNLPQNWFRESKTSFSPELLYINDALGKNTHLAEIKYDARELRDLRLLSYFQRSIIDKYGLRSKLSSLFEKGASVLACCKPFQVPISAIKVVQQHFQVPEGELVYSLNATLVGLGVSKEDEDDTKPCCVGLGILRAVDVGIGLFYVITPLKLNDLQKVNTFLQGRMEIPVSFLKAPGYVSPYLCKNTIAMEGTGSVAMGKGKKKVLRMRRSPGVL